MLNAALKYAKGGLLIFPLHSVVNSRCTCGRKKCSDEGKHPRTKNGFKDATTDEKTIHDWWDRWPNANIGIRLGSESGCFALDIDPRHGGDQSLNELIARYGPLPNTREQRSGGGGRHNLFRHPGRAVHVPNSSSNLAPGIDVRGDDSYIVAAPSLHKSGHRYQWDGLDHTIAPAPQWLLDLILAPPTLGGDSSEPEKIITEGRRHGALLKLAGSMRARGMTKEAIESALLVDNQQRCHPPLSAEEVRAIAHSMGEKPPRYNRPNHNRVAADYFASGSQPVDGLQTARKLVTAGGGRSVARQGQQSYRDTDLGNARRFVDQHRENVRYCPQMGKWFIWEENHWRLDDTDEILRLARKTIESMWREAEAVASIRQRLVLKKWAKRCESEGKIRAMVSLAASELEIHVNPDALDADPWLLNCTNGTVDLRTGELRAHSRMDLCTKLVPVFYDPDAKCPLWRKFLDTITDHKEQLQEFLQTIVGYALTGSTREQAIFMLYGTGANGKSTFIETIRAMLGDYARNANFSTFLAMEESSARNDLARLAGARLVSASEVERGSRFSEVTIKQITGGEPITARYLYREYFEYTPQFKVFLAVNHKPRVRGTEHAIWRRIILVPFIVTIPEGQQDRELAIKLRTQLPGILRWAVEGCLKWQGPGLHQPEAVLDATKEYREEMDVLADFIEARCTLESTAIILSAELYTDYEQFCRNRSEEPLKRNQFGVHLEERGLQAVKTGKQRQRGWKGIKLRLRDDAEREVTDADENHF